MLAARIEVATVWLLSLKCPVGLVVAQAVLRQQRERVVAAQSPIAVSGSWRSSARARRRALTTQVPGEQLQQDPRRTSRGSGRRRHMRAPHALIVASPVRAVAHHSAPSVSSPGTAGERPLTMVAAMVLGDPAPRALTGVRLGRESCHAVQRT